MGIYKVTSPREVLDVEPGGTLEHDFTAEEEADLVAAGRLEILPSEYRNIGGREVYGAQPGETFKAALTVPQAQLLVDGGHVELASSDSKSLDKMNLAELRAYAEQIGVQADTLAALAKPGTSKKDVRKAIDEALTA